MLGEFGSVVNGASFHSLSSRFCINCGGRNQIHRKSVPQIAVICVTKNRTGDYDFRACARARGFRGSTFSAGRICFAVSAERSRDKTCVF